jgi:hypothetical protein
VPAAATAADVTFGSLAWTNFNHRTGDGQPLVTNCPAGKTCTRTFLGYATGIGASPPPPGGSNGAAPTAPATGPTVTPASPFSADVNAPAAYTWLFPTPATGAGTFDPATGAADVEFRGRLTFYAHGLTFFTFTDPRLVLNGGVPDGTDGQIFASGQNTGTMGSTAAPPNYDRGAYIHDLDLRGATTTTNPDGSTTIAGIVPNLNLAAFSGLAGFGQGSDRAPNSQGSFAVTLSSGAAPPPVAQPAAAPPAAAPPTAKKPTKKTRALIGGRATVRLQGAALRGWRARRVRLTGSGGAKLAAGRLELPISGGMVAGWASLHHDGAVTLSAGRRSVRLTGFRTTLRSRSVFISAAIGTHRVTVFAARPARRAVTAHAAAQAIAMRSTPLMLTAAGARAIRRALGLRSLPAGRLGQLTISAGPPGSAGATTKLSRPPRAVDVALAQLTWNVRPSFIRYIAAGEGTSVSQGATADPAAATPETDVPLAYAFHFPFASGWSDPASGRADVRGTGALTFAYKGHGIEITASDPVVVLDGRRSHATFVLNGSVGAKLGGKRSVLMDLDPSKAASKTVSPDGRTTTYDAIPASIPAGAETSVFAGYYIPGEPFGSISIMVTRR